MFRWDAAFVAKKDMNLRPLDPILEALRCQQFINPTGRITSREGDTKPIGFTMKFGVAFNELFRRSRGKLFGSIKNKNVGSVIHTQLVGRDVRRHYPRNDTDQNEKVVSV